MTALHVACMYGHVEATRLLLSVFARTDITDNDRDTPVMLAQQLTDSQHCCRTCVIH
jgi:ankyrin repeat protein